MQAPISSNLLARFMRFHFMTDRKGVCIREQGKMRDETLLTELWPHTLRCGNLSNIAVFCNSIFVQIHRNH